MINVIKIDKFRSFSAPCEISLTPFTLLCGANGAGKSSILESIELCMSGAISRTDALSMAGTIEEVRTAGHKEGLSIELLDKDNHLVCALNDDGTCLNSQQLLKKFYQRDAHHRTAQSMLKTLFATHNLLTQEKVVRLLDADSKDTFDRITREMVAGTDIVERWDKFQRLSDAVSKASQEVMATEERLAAELESIEASIKGLYTIQEKDMIQKSRDIYKTLMNISLKNITDPQNTDLKSLLKWVQDIAVLLKETRTIAQAVRERARETKVLNLNEIRSLINKSNDHLLGTSKLIEQLKKEIESIQRKFSEANEDCIKKKTKLRDQDTLLEELKAKLADIRVIKDWRPELLADFISTDLKKERATLNLELFLYNKASRFLSQLPSIQQLDTSTSIANALRNDHDAKKRIQETLDSEVKQTTEQLRKLKEDFASWKQSQNTLISQYEHLNALVENIFTVRNNLSICPACGTRFPDSQHLMTKIRENIADLRKAEGSLPEMFRSIPVLEETLKEFQQKWSSNNEAIQKVSGALLENEKQIQDWHQNADRLKQTLTTLRFPGSEDQGQTDLKTFCNYATIIDMSEYRQDLQRKINSVDSRLSELWHGLRKDQYLESADAIKGKLENRPELSTIVADDTLLKNRIEETKQKLKELTETRDRSKKELDDWLLQAVSLKGQTEIKKTKLSELRVQKSEQEEKTKEQVNLLSAANELNSFLLKPLSILNMEEIQKKLISASAHAEGFEESLVLLLQSLKIHKEYEKRKIEITDQRKENRKKLILIKQTKSGIASVTPLEERLRKEWQQYKTYINDLFLKLQTPPDFGEIKLHGDTLNFDLRVVSRVSGEDKPANESVE